MSLLLHLEVVGQGDTAIHLDVSVTHRLHVIGLHVCFNGVCCQSQSSRHQPSQAVRAVCIAATVTAPQETSGRLLLLAAANSSSMSFHFSWFCRPNPCIIVLYLILLLSFQSLLACETGFFHLPIFSLVFPLLCMLSFQR